MYALDTNVLVRYLLQDDAEQSGIANHVIENLTPTRQGFVSCIVLCEIIWVLSSRYHVAKQQCVTTLKQIFSVPVFDIEHLDNCLRALRSYERGNADFSDYLIQEIAHEQGYRTMLTFDKKALRSKRFRHPETI